VIHKKPDSEHRDPGDDGYDTSGLVAAVLRMAEDSLAGRDRQRVRAAARRFAALFGRRPCGDSEGGS
jgi:hypothetical protein